MEDKQFAVLVNGEPRSTNAGGGIRTYKTRERAIKENMRYSKSFWKDKKIEVAEVTFTNLEEIK